MDVGARVLRDGVVINTISSVTKNVQEYSVTNSVSLCSVDSSTSTKSTTYTVQLYTNGSCSASASNRSLVIHYAFR